MYGTCTAHAWEPIQILNEYYSHVKGHHTQCYIVEATIKDINGIAHESDYCNWLE